MFTFIPIADIQSLMSEHQVDASKRIPQHKLAYEVLCLVHGDIEAKKAAAQHAQMFKRRPAIQPVIPSSTTEESTAPDEAADASDPLEESTTPSKSADVFNSPKEPTKPIRVPDMANSLNKNAPITTVYDSPSLNVTLPSSLVVDRPIAKVLFSAGLVASGSEGHRLCVQQGAYVGSRPADQGPMQDELTFTPCKNWLPEDTSKHIIDGKFLILRVGKWRMKIVKIISDKEFDANGLTAPGWPLEEMVPDEETDHPEDIKPSYDEHTGARKKLSSRRQIISTSQIKKQRAKEKADAKLEDVLKDVRSLWGEGEGEPNNHEWRAQAEREIAGILRYGSSNERKKMAQRYGLDVQILKKSMMDGHNKHQM